MVARVEPPRARATPAERSPEASRYPGLDPTERLLPLDPPSLAASDDEPPPPLWIAPIEVPPADRSVGFVAALPELLPELLPDPPSVDREPPEGLFDVPGLLERLWLARALEARREPLAAASPVRLPLRTRAPPEAPRRDPAPTPVTPAPEEPRSAAAETGAPAATSSPAPTDRRSTPPESLPAPVSPTAVRSWICPYCYLTNDLGTTACAGCRRPAPSS